MLYAIRMAVDKFHWEQIQVSRPRATSHIMVDCFEELSQGQGGRACIHPPWIENATKKSASYDANIQSDQLLGFSLAFWNPSPPRFRSSGWNNKLVTCPDSAP